MDNGTILPKKGSLNPPSLITDTFHHLEFFIEYLSELIDLFSICKKNSETLFNISEISLSHRPSNRHHTDHITPDTKMLLRSG